MNAASSTSVMESAAEPPKSFTYVGNSTPYKGTETLIVYLFLSFWSKAECDN